MRGLGELKRNSIFNLIGNGLPMLVAIFTIPRLVGVMGVERFGILTLTWVVMGYFSLFDLGLGRALTQIVAERTNTENHQDLPDIIRTALSLMLLFGIIGGLALGLFIPVGVSHVLKLPPTLHREAYYAFGLMAFSVPAVTMMAGLRGILEARQNFLEISVLKLGMGIFTFMGPWLVSFKTVNLFWIVLTLEVMRYGALVGHYLVCRALIPEIKQKGKICARHRVSLIKFGSWMTLSNIISPLMVNMDRFFIGAFISVSAIAYYATPFDIIIRILVIPGAILPVLFPMFGSMYRSDPEQAVRLYRKAMKLIFVILAPVLLTIAAGSKFILLHWLGQNFASNSAVPMRILCLGVLVNGLAGVPFAFIQGNARPDITAKFHMAEAPLYILILWQLALHFGVAGVAWAWTIRVSMDFILLSLAAVKLQRFPALITE